MRYHKLILSILTILLTFLLTTTQMFAAGVPQMIPYSGTIAVNGAPFNGNGQFKFAIVSQGCEDTEEATPCTSLWSNDNSKTDGTEPTNYVTITVNNGSFGVKLGDISLKNVPSNTDMFPILDAVFASPNDNTYLRIWFNDGVTSFQQLSPDRQFVSTPYAYRATTVDNVGAGQIDDGSITTAKIANGAVGSAQIADGTVTITDLAFDPATQAELDAHKGGGDHDSRYPAKTDLSTAGTINTAGNPVDWTKLKSVPAGFADGVDDTGAGGPASDVVCIGCVDSTDIANNAVGSAQINTAQVQNRVSGTCTAGSSIRTINSDGIVVCESDDNTTYTAGSGIKITGTTISMADGYTSVSALVGIPRNSTYSTNQATVGGGVGRYGTAGAGSEYLVVPLSIPNGATITGFYYMCYDNDVTLNSSAFLYRDDVISMASVVTAGNSATIQTVSQTTINNPVVNNSLYGYYVYMEVNGGAGTNLAPIRAVVKYTMP